MCRLLEKFDPQHQSKTHVITEMQFELEDIEHQLIFNMAQWPDTIWYAATHFQPHLISNYCLKLARLFHTFYEHCSIGSASPSVQIYRLLIVKQLQNVLQCALNVLGVSAPKRM
jgi:arginyl-tRNA synthetase